MWLRLVQSARSREEQNLEAYVKNGQLFFRALRAIQKEEELLVWYGKELSNLLLLKPMQPGKGADQYKCVNCDQRFESEFPLLAHWRFICTLRQPSSLTKLGNDKPQITHDSPDPVTAIKMGQPQNDPQDGKPTTDFHNLARDMEKNGNSSSFPGVRSAGALKRKCVEVEVHRKSSQIPTMKQEPMDRGYDNFSVIQQLSPVSSHLLPNRFSEAFPEERTTQPQMLLKLSETELLTANPQNQKDQPRGRPAKNKLSNNLLCLEEPSTDIISSRPGKSKIFVPENRSVFSPATRYVSLPDTTRMLDRAKPSVIDKTYLHRQNPSPYLHKPISIKPRHPLYSPAALWSRNPDRDLVQVPPSPVLLAPSVPRLSPLCMPAQNWCAKCNFSFRLTSDLVQHMRSHHKRALDATESGSGMKRQYNVERGDPLKCPICNEVFRQRHHLARHLTSHA
ncbi:hypothetical protein DPEC_G00333410 [Dallia pectoralis]|uniref:Uncharacterized protein n=1 Tax=Dallia pectoralis TaxID=75939 RepID=A0ACC2F6C6_DALPE|nr:hypothetical protein DPEC_G00333410 [Dallia pectoralis]